MARLVRSIISGNRVHLGRPDRWRYQVTNSLIAGNGIRPLYVPISVILSVTRLRAQALRHLPQQLPAWQQPS